MQSHAKPKVLLVIPAYNEGGWIARNLQQVSEYIAGIADRYAVTIMGVDNNSSDDTAAHIQSVPGVVFRREPIQGKGYAVLGAWEAHPGAYDIYAFLDADLATDLSVLPGLFEAAAKGSVGVCTRHHAGSDVRRPLMRLFVSKCSAALTRLLLRTSVSDCMCGCKAFPAAVIERHSKLVGERQWFFDTELVLRAERSGVSISEFPVRWREHRQGENKSKVRVFRTALRHVALMLRLRSRV